MKFKMFTLLALVAMLMGTAACGAEATPTPAATATANPADITLVPYTSRDFGVSGIVPEGWVEVKPGHFQRTPGSDPTLLGQVAIPGATIEQVMDIGQLPESVGRTESASLAWDLYSAELDWPDAGTLLWDIALAEGDAGVYIVALVVLDDEHEALYDAVFVPAIEALTPATVSGEIATATPAAPLLDRPNPIDTRVRTADGMVMVYVPAGEFEMGNTGI